MDPNYSREELVLLISGAKQLGFWDDVDHFQKLLDKLQD